MSAEIQQRDAAVAIQRRLLLRADLRVPHGRGVMTAVCEGLQLFRQTNVASYPGVFYIVVDAREAQEPLLLEI